MPEEKPSRNGSPNKGPADLAAEVFDQDRCAVCGACVGPCPYFSHYRGRVLVRDRCTLPSGRCYDFCPMAGAKGAFIEPLGEYKRLFIARSARAEFRRNTQYGGVVSTLVVLALKEGLVGEAVATSGHPEAPPRGVRVNKKSQVLAAAGSRYAASGAVAVLNQALAEPGLGTLALVGTPCQIKAAAAMRRAKASDVSFHPRRIKLLLGLFCTWALDYRRLSSYLRFMLFGERAFGYDIPPPPADVFKVFTGDGVKAFPLEEIRRFRLGACRFCDDMTSTQADVSVGACEGLDGWNTVIVRTAAGKKLVDLALDRNLLRVDEMHPSDLEHLREAAGLKRERGLAAWNLEG
ncbi:MAG: Coenzyme F420 hydrogenase/dehydrogenase, beta subunit C-terminal domain [Thermodesulfobacteriota bacterium]